MIAANIDARMACDGFDQQIEQLFHLLRLPLNGTRREIAGAARASIPA